MVIKTQIPLLNDHHSHPFLFAVLSNCINLASVRTKEQALSMMENAQEEINVILGWNNRWYSFEKEELDHLPPVVICNTFHRFVINQATHKKLATAHPELLTHIDEEGWVERNFAKIINFILTIKSYHPEQIATFYHYLLQQGVWYVEDMSLPNERVIHLLKQLGYLERTLFWAEIETFSALSQEAQREIYGINIFLDGALGSETAALKRPYLTTGKQGVLVYSDKALQAIISQVAKINKPIAFHAIGDQAITQVVTVLTQIKAEQGIIPPTRIEHCQFISQPDAEKAKALGVILSMQPSFNLDSIQYQDRLPEKYCAQNNPFRMLIDEIGFVPGIDLILGSDVMQHNLTKVLECALFPPFSNQALTLDEFVGGYCLPDKKRGYIEVTVDEEKQRVSTEVKIR
ncbi:MAG: hypothetical protein DRR19_26235 [Candidatus Parabeggiatoa sp. nov. 1]|nr:MAG: hypothetical protein DRR19_26235 [Gammaproteobacteria bacterium]